MKSKLKKANEDFHFAMVLGIAVLFGQVQSEAEDVVEMYVILRRWKRRLKDNVPTELIKILEAYEDVFEPLIMIPSVAFEEEQSEPTESSLDKELKETMDILTAISFLNPTKPVS